MWRSGKGYAVAFHWHGTERPRFSTDRIDHPDGRWRNVAHTACRRLCDAGLIATDGYVRSCHYDDWSEPYWLTDAGRHAADDLADLPEDVMFAPPRVTQPEKLDQARNRRHAAKVIMSLTFNQGRIRGHQLMFPGSGSSLTSPYDRGLHREITCDVMTLLTPDLEGSPTSTAKKACGSPKLASQRRRNGDPRNVDERKLEFFASKVGM